MDEEYDYEYFSGDELVAMGGDEFAELGYEELGFGFFKKIGKAVGSAAKGVAKAAKSVVRSPIVKVGLSGAALVFPPAIPAAAAVIVADKVLTAAESGSAQAKAAAKKVIKTTAGLAAKGDPNAKRAVQVLKKVAKAPPALRAQVRGPRFKVTARGRVTRLA